MAAKGGLIEFIFLGHQPGRWIRCCERQQASWKLRMDACSGTLINRYEVLKIFSEKMFCWVLLVIFQTNYCEKSFGFSFLFTSYKNKRQPRQLTYLVFISRCFQVDGHLLIMYTGLLTDEIPWSDTHSKVPSSSCKNSGIFNHSKNHHSILDFL